MFPRLPECLKVKPHLAIPLQNIPWRVGSWEPCHKIPGRHPTSDDLISAKKPCPVLLLSVCGGIWQDRAVARICVFSRIQASWHVKSCHLRYMFSCQMNPKNSWPMLLDTHKKYSHETRLIWFDSISHCHKASRTGEPRLCLEGSIFENELSSSGMGHIWK